MKNTKNLTPRLLMYLLGVFLITIGVAMAVKSDLGVTPIMTIPYAITCTVGWEMGKLTIVFHALLVGLQLLLLRREFQWKNLLQVVAGFLFGYCTTFSNHLFSLLPPPGNLGIRLGLSVLSSAILGLGIFFYLPANVMPLAPDATMATLARVLKLPQSRAKVLFDCINIAIGLTICLLALGESGSVGVGTIIGAVLVGTWLGFFSRHFGPARDRFLKGKETV